jgi:hypothetical protein
MSRENIQKVINSFPNLTDFGIGFYDEKKLNPVEYNEKLHAQQEDLLKSAESFEKTCIWIKENIKEIQSINTKHTSYGLKHLAEKHVGYITNGVFIAAAIHCGFKVKVYPGSPNVSFNMSEKSITLLQSKR